MQTRRYTNIRYDDHAASQRPESDTWDANALCLNSDDPDTWFPNPTDKDAVELARAICGRCPAADACFAQAVERREVHGVWGGVLFTMGKSRRRLMEERRAFLRRLARGTKPPRKRTTKTPTKSEQERTAELTRLIEEQRAELDAAVAESMA